MEHSFFKRTAVRQPIIILNLGDLAENLSSTKCKTCHFKENSQWCSDKCLTTRPQGQRKFPICRLIANFGGVNTPSVVDFKLLDVTDTQHSVKNR